MHCDAFGGLDQNRPPLVSIYENEPMWGDVTSWRRAAQFQLPHPEAGEVKCQLGQMVPLGKQILCAFEDGNMKIMDSMSFSTVRDPGPRQQDPVSYRTTCTRPFCCPHPQIIRARCGTWKRGTASRRIDQTDL